MTNRILRHRYQIISELGKGGFGKTYLAIDLDLPNNPQCVVKQLAPDDPRPQVFQVAKELFDKEAKILHRLGKHEQIPQLFAYFEEGGEFYLVQEFIEGYDLAEEIYSRSRFTENQTVQLLTEIFAVLKYVHEQNVIHRDLKPQNIRRRKSDGKIVLIDFGAVKEIKGLTIIRGGQTSRTRAVGTPGYMPAEQWSGQPKFCSDIYAVGIIAIKALTGVRINQFPKDSSTGEIIWKDRVNVSDDLGRVLDKMVLYDWRKRYQSIDEVMIELIDNNGNSLSQQQTVVINKNQFNNQQTTVPDTALPHTHSWVKIVLGVGIGITCSAFLALIINPKIFSREVILHADYSTLEKLLAEGKWKEADRETENIMLQVANRKSEAWLNSVSIDKFPCSDLKKINRLWVENSNGYFGFTVQKPIYLETGNKPRKFQDKPYKLFGKTVGWYQNERWLKYDELVFSSPENSPKGHLPAPHRQTTSAAFAPYAYLIDRLDKCNNQ